MEQRGTTVLAAIFIFLFIKMMSLKKMYMIIIAILAMMKDGNAQVDIASLRITYNVKHLLDTTNEKSIISYPLYLFVGSKMTVSKSQNKHLIDSVNERNMQLAQMNPEHIVLDGSALSMRRISTFESIVTYNNLETKVFTEIGEIGFSKYLIKDNVKPISWILKNEFCEIAGRKAQLALCTFKGRNWSVWFSADIPIPYGPWKFAGLPGLVMKAVDEKMQISFEFAEIVKLSPPQPIKFVPKEATAVNQHQFLKLLASYADDPGQFIKNQSGIDFGSNFNTPQGGQPRMKVPNNPIDLSGN